MIKANWTLYYFISSMILKQSKFFICDTLFLYHTAAPLFLVLLPFSPRVRWEDIKQLAVWFSSKFEISLRSWELQQLTHCYFFFFFCVFLQILTSNFCFDICCSFKEWYLFLFVLLGNSLMRRTSRRSRVLLHESYICYIMMILRKCWR